MDDRMINRRGIIGMLLGAASTPATGAKTAAAALGLDLNSPTMMAEAAEASGISSSAWWGSSLNIAFDSRREAQFDANRPGGGRYGHMKSWGHAFRRSVVQKELIVERIIVERANKDEAFLARITKAIG